MVLHNPNNWHWVNKDASVWAKDYFSEQLTGIKAAEADGTSVEISKVLEVDGDVDVSQRKGKVITLFDVKIRLEFNGKTAGGQDVSGTITIPEVAHDTEKDEYVFETSIYSDSKDKDSVRELIRNQLTPQLRTALYKFSSDLIEHHGKDIQHAPGSGPGTGSSTPVPKPVSTSSTSKSTTSTSSSSSSSKGVVNTVTLTDTAEFRTTAAELFTTFTDPSRVAAFTRAPPQVFEPKVGGNFILFGGNVSGSFISLDEDKHEIVQKWRLASWPKEHYSTLKLVFDQGYDATTLRYTWEGVPVGQEDVAKRNFGDYYVKSIKTTFGFGAVF